MILHLSYKTDRNDKISPQSPKSPPSAKSRKTPITVTRVYLPKETIPREQICTENLYTMLIDYRGSNRPFGMGIVSIFAFFFFFPPNPPLWKTAKNTVSVIILYSSIKRVHIHIRSESNQ